MTAAKVLIQPAPGPAARGAQIEGLFDALPEGLVLQDMTGAVRDFNASALDILGVTADQLALIASPDGRAGGAHAYGDLFALTPEALASGVTQADHAARLRTPTGQSRYFSITASPVVTGSDAGSVWVVTTFRDVTHEMRSRRRRDLVRTLDSLPTPIAYFDENVCNVHANEHYAGFFGQTPEQLKGRALADILGPKAFAKHFGFLADVLESRRVSFDGEITSHDGVVHYKFVNYVPDIVDGHVEGFYVFVADVSALRRAEEERKELQSRLISSSKMTMLGEMAAGVAHEINNPLGIIGGTAGLLRMAISGGRLDEQALRTGLDKIDATVHRIAGITRGLRTFARDADFDPTEVVVFENVLNDTFHLCRERLRARQIDVRLSVPVGTALRCRPTQVSQILMNLIGNAIDAIETLPEKWIEVRTEIRGDRLCISVVDSGTGIAEDVAERMLNPFFTTKPHGRGTGLGLSISKGLAESNGGTLTYDPTQPNTCFVVELPAK